MHSAAAVALAAWSPTAARAGASRAGPSGPPQGGPVWRSCPAPPGGAQRKVVSFAAAPECFGPADPAEELVQAPPGGEGADSGARLSSPAAGGGWLGAPAVWQEGVPDRAASAAFGGASGPAGAQQEEEDAALAEIEAFADEQARRFAPLVDKRRARRTATVSIGRAKRADGISFQMESSALWQRRGVTGSGLGALGCVLG
ncbi:unnamed protein product [Prorocentrum cordatum]|uniref:Uncharacterized protein n=1 Tax=Prorocentrum cordatum TaxID=2364126 RepID=A0ABN9W947_9DINO|nr:unnamed protein product [Polarella glacialis]